MENRKLILKVKRGHILSPFERGYFGGVVKSYGFTEVATNEAHLFLYKKPVSHYLLNDLNVTIRNKQIQLACTAPNKKGEVVFLKKPLTVKNLISILQFTNHIRT